MLTVRGDAITLEQYTSGTLPNSPIPWPRRIGRNLRGLPPAFLCIAGCDILGRTANRGMAARFAAAHVPCESQLYPGATHSFPRAVSIRPAAERATRRRPPAGCGEQLTGARRGHGRAVCASSHEDIVRIVADHPLAWVISRDFQATPLPLIAETDAPAPLWSLLGHFARRNPQVAALQGNPDALILFQGPSGLYFPRLVSNPDLGSNLELRVVRFEVTVAFVPDEIDAAVERLAAHLEHARHDPWRVEELGGRYDQLRQQIIAFSCARTRHGVPRSSSARTKSAPRSNEIVAGLATRRSRS